MEPLFTFLAKLPDPLGCPAPKLRMILVFPGSYSTFEGFDLL
jgi:hypothetical protein